MSKNIENRITELRDGGCSDAVATEFATADLTLSEVQEYVAAGLNSWDIHIVQELQISPKEYSLWAKIFDTPAEIGRAARMGLSPESIDLLFEGKNKFDQRIIFRMLEQGVTVKEIKILEENEVNLAHSDLGYDLNLRDQFMSQLFGSMETWKAWKPIRLEVDEALALKKSGITPYQYLVGNECASVRPKCTYLSDAKKYRFEEDPPIEILGLFQIHKDIPILRAFGYDVKKSSLKTEFLESDNSCLLLNLGNHGRSPIIISIREEADHWFANSFHALDAFHLAGKSKTLNDLWDLILNKLITEKKRIKDIEILDRKVHPLSFYSAEIGKWFASVSKKDFPKINGERSQIVQSASGDMMLLPMGDATRERVGRDEILRLGDIALRYVGRCSTPLVVISSGDDIEIRAETEDLRSKLPKKDIASLLIIRHVMVNKSGTSDGEEPDDEEKSYETLINAFFEHEIREVALKDKELWLVKANEVLEIHFTANVIEQEEIVNLLTVHKDGEWLDRDYFYVVNEICEQEDLPIFESLVEPFCSRPVVINGTAWLAVNEANPVFLELESGDFRPFPKFSEVWGSLSMIEWESRTSGTDYEDIGLARSHQVVQYNTFDWQEPTMSYWYAEEDDYPSHLATWLLDDNYSYYFKAYLFVEQMIGELPRTAEIYADWVVSDWSSTMMIGFSASLGSAGLDQKVLEILLQNDSVAEYVRGITDIGSPEYLERIRRHKAYYNERTTDIQIS